METKRKGRAPPPTGGSKKKFSTSVLGKRSSKGSGSKELRYAEKEKERRNLELKSAAHDEKEKEKFNIIEEFFICLACIFD